MALRVSDLPERVRKRIVVSERVPELGPCWIWQGSTCGRDREYGHIRMNRPRRMVKVHRYTYELMVGKIPKGKQIHHKCEIKSCCNPDHLEPVTNEENRRRHIPYQSKKTHCKRGHPLFGANVYLHNGSRNCRECRRTTARNAYRRRVGV